MSALSDLLSTVPGGVRIPIQAQPRAGRDRVVGVHGEAIKVQIASAPVDGAANEGIVRFLAKLLRVSKGSVALVQGERSRHKVVEVSGLELSEVAARLEDACG